MILTELNTLSWHEWDNMVEKLKHRVFLLLETKEHLHPLGRFFKYFLIFLITLNTLVVCIESIDEMFKIYISSVQLSSLQTLCLSAPQVRIPSLVTDGVTS